MSILYSNVEIVESVRSVDPNDPKTQSFAHPGATLLTLEDRRNVVIEGAAQSVLRMRPEEYPFGQYRHTIKVTGCERIQIQNLNLQDSGGDGIYIGRTVASNLDCRDIQLMNISCRRNRRNGLSVTSVDGLDIQDCTFAETKGEGPESGIDLEPNTADDRLANITMLRCRIENNASFGIVISCRNLMNDSVPVSIRIEQSYISGNRGIDIIDFFDDCPNCPTGSVKVLTSTIENVNAGIIIHKDATKDLSRVRSIVSEISKMTNDGPSKSRPTSRQTVSSAVPAGSPSPTVR
jgi:hypothetical protein